MADETKTKTIQIPEKDVDGVLVDCPMIKHDLRPVVECFKCDHFATLVDRDPENVKGREFHKRHIVGCKYPTARPLFKLRKEETEDAGAK